MCRFRRLETGLLIWVLLGTGPLCAQSPLEDPPKVLPPLEKPRPAKASSSAPTPPPSPSPGAGFGGPPPLQVPALPPENADPVDSYIKGLWAWKRAGLLEAIFQLEAALRADPQALAVKQSLVPLYLTFERRNEARDLGLEVLASRPDEYELALLVGRICRQLRQYDEAEKILAAARERSGLRELPALRVQLLVELAQVSEAAQKWEQAFSALGEVAGLLAEPGSLAEGPYSPEQIVLQRSEVHERMGKLAMRMAAQNPTKGLAIIDQALENFLQAGKLDPGRMARLALHLAEIMETKQQNQDAMVRVDEYLATRPPGIEGYELKVRLMEKMGRAEEVMPFLEEAYTKNKINSGLALMLAKRLAANGDLGHAENLFLKELTRPMGPMAAKELLALWAGQGAEGAVKLLEKLEKAFVGSDPKNATLDAAMRPADPSTVRSLFAALRHQPKLTRLLFAETVARLGKNPPPSEAIRFFLANQALRINDWNTSLALYATLAKDKSHIGVVGADLASGWARSALMLGKSKETLDIAARLIPSLAGPLRVNVRIIAAEAHVRLGDLPAALKELTLAEGESELKDKFRCQLSRVWIYAMAGREEEALAQGKTLLESLILPGDRKEAKRVLSAVLMMLERNDEALTLLRELLREDPNDPGVANDLGYLLVDLGRDLEEGEKLVRKAIELDRMAMGEENPEKSSIVDSLGWVHFRRGRLKEAREELKRALDLPGGIDQPVIFEHLGDVEWALGQPEEARKCWQTALELYDKGVRPDRKNRVGDLKRKLERPAGETPAKKSSASETEP